MQRLDQQLANLLHGDHPIEGSKEERVVALEELMILFNATNKAGWARHTGDWDWAATVTLADGEKIGEGDAIWSIEFAYRPANFTACIHYDKVTHLRLEGEGYDEEDEPYDISRQVHINQVTNIYWEQR